MVKVIRAGFQDWIQIRSFVNMLEGVVVDYKPRTKAGIIHEHIKKYSKRTFEQIDDIVLGEFNGVFGLVVKNELFIRFKKMDKGFSVNSYFTLQHKKYLAQAQIEGFPETPTFLFAGYIPDRTWSEILGVYVACWVNDRLEWVDEFGNYSSQQAYFDFDKKEDQVYKEIEKRVKGKIKIRKQGGNKKQNGSENSQ